MIKILNRWNNTVIFEGKESETLLQVVERAVSERANLDNARLDNARLDNARLDNARLDNASLDGARLDNASLDNARLDGARLDGARLDNASLVGASLVGASLDNARLDNARLDGARLDNARLDGARLDNASLDQIRNDFWDVLLRAQPEIPSLRLALVEGRVDGSTYEGECACLVGTIAKARSKKYTQLVSLKPNSNRPIERFFMGISKGDKPAKNQISKLAIKWIDEFLELQGVTK